MSHHARSVSCWSKGTPVCFGWLALASQTSCKSSSVDLFRSRLIANASLVEVQIYAGKLQKTAVVQILDPATLWTDLSHRFDGIRTSWTPNMSLCQGKCNDFACDLPADQVEILPFSEVSNLEIMVMQGDTWWKQPQFLQLFPKIGFSQTR